MVTRLKDAERELYRARREQVQAAAGNLTEKARDVNGRYVNLGHDAVEPVAADDVRKLALDVRGRLDADRPGVVAIIGAADGPPGRGGRDQRRSAGPRHQGRRAGAGTGDGVLGGGGGGKDDIAQGGGPTRPRSARPSRPSSGASGSLAG